MMNESSHSSAIGPWSAVDPFFTTTFMELINQLAPMSAPSTSAQSLGDAVNILKLPRELLQSIVSQVPPEGVTALAATCKLLYELLQDEYIWRKAYSSRFDVPATSKQHFRLYEEASWQRQALKRTQQQSKGKQREENSWNAEEQTKRLALAVKKVRLGAACELDMLNHQADTVGALLAVAVSSSPRNVKSGDYNDRELSSRTTRTLSRLFSDSKWGKVAYSNWIYPRETVTAMAEHQRELEMQEIDDQQALPPTLRKVWRQGQQCNARLDKQPEEVPLIDEEAAAHLHCLHGPRDFLVNGAENDSDEQGGQRWPSRRALAEVGTVYGLPTTRPGPKTQACVIRETVFQDSHDNRDTTANVAWEREFVVKEESHRDFPAEGSSAVQLDEPVEDSDDDEERMAEKRLYLPVLKNLIGGYSLGSKTGSEGDLLLRAAARRIVYDVSRFGWENCYGPFHVFRSDLGQRASKSFHPPLAAHDSPPDEASDNSTGEVHSPDSDDEGHDHNYAGGSDEDIGDDSSSLHSEDEEWNVDDLRLLAARAYGSVPKETARVMLENKGLLPKKRIAWLVVEAAQVVMHCNLFHAQLHGWGAGFFHNVANPYALSPQLGMPKTIFPFDQRVHDNDANSDMPKDSFDRHETAELWARATHTLCTPRGWDHSRGEAVEFSATSSSKPVIHDWAHLEGVWCGTFAFLPYADWVVFNASTAHSRGFKVYETDTRDLPKIAKDTLAFEGEAIGDFVQIRLSLVEPPAAAEDCEPIEDADFPPLYFEGHTLRYDSDGSSAVRGFPRGVVRPVFAPDKDGRACKAIEGLHWSVVHSYDDAERWKLEGVQAGQPGTRAAVYGIWTEAQRDDEGASTPCGAWCYWRVDDRKWKDIEAEISNNEARVRSHQGQGNW